MDVHSSYLQGMFPDTWQRVACAVRPSLQQAQLTLEEGTVLQTQIVPEFPCAELHRDVFGTRVFLRDEAFSELRLVR